MALGNWATKAWTLSGKPCGGRFSAPSGLVVEIYKNWLYLSDPRMWNDGIGFSKPTFAEMWEGKLVIGPVAVFASRGPQSSVLLAVRHVDYQTHGETGMVGIGCYGYRGDDWTGVEPATIDVLEAWLSSLRHAEGMPRTLPALRGEGEPA